MERFLFFYATEMEKIDFFCLRRISRSNKFRANMLAFVRRNISSVLAGDVML